MNFRAGISASIGAAAALAAAAPRGAAEQSSETIVSDAQATLDRIARLLDAAAARHRAATRDSAAPAATWIDLFDGSSLRGWKRTEFAGGGEVRVEPHFQGGGAAIVVDAGPTLSGFGRSDPPPRTDYEISVEWMKIDGNDFGCGITFPVGDSFASLILGGWGGGVTGISSIDHQDASENETTKFSAFPKGRWFRTVLRVTREKLEAWLDGKKIVDVSIADRKIDLRPGEIYKSKPFGIATYATSAAFRTIRMRKIGGMPQGGRL